MKTIGFLRHAKSSWDDASASDFDRVLNKRGRKAATAIGPVVREAGFDLVVASPARRVAETLERAGIADIDWRPEIYGIDVTSLLALIRQTPDSVRSLLVAGHNPTMFGIANALAAEEPAAEGGGAERALLAEKYPTGAFALIALPIERWSEAEEEQGKLVRFVRPRDL